MAMEKKEKLLFLCHRIPFPPNKGDKIRSFNLLRHLSQQYEVYLGCFVDDKEDWQHVEALDKWCFEVCSINLHPSLAKLKGVLGILRNRTVTMSYFFDWQLQTWVDQTLEYNQIDKILVFSSSMAQYVDDEIYNDLHRVIDFVDVDSDKWRQYARNSRWPMKWLYSRESRLLSQYEHQIADEFSASMFVSDQEVALFRQQPQARRRDDVFSVLNGVNINYFSPQVECERPAIQSPLDLVFTGAMDYWANVDAVLWFAREVWPGVHKHYPDSQFIIVGGNPDPRVQKLRDSPGIRVTGRVADVRPYIQHAAVTVAPLRIARGIQNKVLEAMAMGKAVVATTMAIEGLTLPPSGEALVMDDAQPMIDTLLALLATSEHCCELGKENRRWVERHYTWQQTLAPLAQILEVTQPGLEVQHEA